jgi:DNA-binding MarR family transcriptional regulator
MLVPLGKALTAAELPVLATHGLTMWGYVVLLRLGEEPIRTQAALADRIGADKTRLIDVLDALQDQGLIRREPDPSDRRARLVSLTAQGRRTRDNAQRAIQRGEQRLLDQLSPTDQRALLRVLQTLHRLDAEALLDVDRPT